MGPDDMIFMALRTRMYVIQHGMFRMQSFNRHLWANLAPPTKAVRPGLSCVDRTYQLVCLDTSVVGGARV